MGFLDRLLGRETRAPEPPADDRVASSQNAGAASSEDERALERYRYLVRTAPPDRIEQAHEEAFARLTPEQRRLALEQLSREAPEERPDDDEPRSLARAATRAELRRPGTIERAFGGGGMGGVGMGGLGMGAGLLGSFATAFAGTLAAQALFSDLADGELFDGPQDGDAHDGGDAGDSGDASDGGDTGGADLADAGGDLGGGDLGGDFGGGDF
jgi:hypothetical protein